MPTTFTVFSLGNLTDIDTTEGNNLAENAADLNGLTFGGVQDALLNDAVTFSPGTGGFDGDGTTAYNQDNSPGENFQIDGGGDQVFDSAAIYNATVTYIDGTTATITAVIFQDVSGNTYWAPEFSANTDQGNLEFAAIRSLTLNSVSGDSFSGLAGTREDWNFVTCYLAGTHIETADGPRPIEELRVGDKVRTRDHGLQEIRWIGQSKVKGHGKLAPVRIMAGSLGSDCPTQDLLVSRQHRMLISSKVCARMFGSDEILVPAIKLTTLPGVFVEESVQDITYFHLMTDAHEVIYAEGAPSETLLTGPQAVNALSPEALEELEAIFPDVLKVSPVPARPIQRDKRIGKLLDRHIKNGIPHTAAQH